MRSSDVHPLGWWLVKVVVGCVLVARLLEHQLLGGLPTFSLPAVWLGRIAVGFGALVSVGHYVLLKRRVSDVSAPETLVTETGLFRYVRHPMYAGDVVLYAGLTWLVPGVISVLLFVVGSYAIYRQALVEDQHLADRFGSEFERWRVRTGLLIPTAVWSSRRP